MRAGSSPRSPADGPRICDRRSERPTAPPVKPTLPTRARRGPPPRSPDPGRRPPHREADRGSLGSRRDPSLYFAAMSVRPIVMLGDQRLRLKGKPVDSFGAYLHELLDDLAHTMRDAPGVGLAAPQLGEPLQACVIEVEGTLHELVNPRMVRASGDDRDLEGCLSIPGFVAYVTRRERVWVAAQDRFGKKVRVDGSGLLGRGIQQ